MTSSVGLVMGAALDDLNKVILEIEDHWRRKNRIRAAIDLSAGERLVWSLHDGVWGFRILSIDRSRDTKLASAPWELRVAAVKKLPELWAESLAAREQGVEQIQQATTEAEDFLAGLLKEE